MLNYELINIYWSSCMDIIAVLNKDNSIEVYRISYKSHKIFQIEENQQITLIQFSPDCKILFLKNK